MITRQFDIVLNTKVLKTLSSNMVVTQNDKDVNLLKIRIFNGNEEIDYLQINKGEIFFEKKDKNVVQGDLEKVTDGFTYQMGTNEIACIGEVLAIVHLYGNSGERLATSKFKFEVERDLESESAIKSSSQYGALQKILVEFNEAFSDIINGISEEIPEIIQARHDPIRNTTFQNLRARLDADSVDIDELKLHVGDLHSLNTNEKSNIVEALNEVNDKIEEIEIVDMDAENVTYDNTESELEAENVQDAIDEVDTNLKTHQAETMSQVIAISRDISITGTQTIETQKKAKAISVIATSQSSNLPKSWGFWAQDNTQFVAVSYGNGNGAVRTDAIVIGESAGTRAEGKIQNVTDHGFDIVWTKTGSPTGTISLLFHIFYHGE